MLLKDFASISIMPCQTVRLIKDLVLSRLHLIAHYVEYNMVLIEHHQQFMSRWQLLATHKLAAEVVISCLTKEK